MQAHTSKIKTQKSEKISQNNTLTMSSLLRYFLFYCVHFCKIKNKEKE